MITSILLMLGLSSLNMLFFAYVLMAQQYYLLYIIFNVSSYFFFRKLYFRDSKDYHGLPVELYFFFPGFGGLVVSLTLSLLHYIKTDSLMIEDYENYIRFQNKHMNPERFDYDATVQTMSALDVMSYYGDKLKKELIVSHNSGLQKEGIDLLRLGNLDDDTEVQHYAAVTLSTLENNLNNEMRHLHSRLEKSNNYQVLDRLLELYKGYIDSSLLDDDTLMIYNSMYIDLLEKRSRSMGEFYDYALDLYNAYLRQMSFNNAAHYYELMVETFGEKAEMLLLKMKLDHQLGNGPGIQGNKEKLEKIYHDQIESLSQKQISQIAFWIGIHRKEDVS